MLISLVTPSFNSADTIEQTLTSVTKTQESTSSLYKCTYDLDYHLVDAGSNDGTLDIIHKYSSHLSSVTSEPDEGLYSGLNKGFKRCHGEVMGWLNSDDFLLPGTLQTVAEIFQTYPSIQWITSLTQLAADCQGRITVVKTIPGICAQAIADGAYLPGIVRHAYGHIQQESTFWRRSLWEACGAALSERSGLAGDYELWQRFAQVSNPVGVTAPLGVFRLRAGQASSGSRYKEDLRQIWNSQTRSRQSRASARMRGQLRGLLPVQLHSRMPRFLRMAPQACRYAGERLLRLRPEGPLSSWFLESHLFL